MTVQGELRQVLAELELVSQVSAVDLDPTARDTSQSIGGNRPSGGINRKDDREPDYPQKSVEHFRWRAAGARSEYQLALILKDARVALEAAKRQPEPGNIEPERGTLAWRRMIANSPDTARELGRRFELSQRTVHRYREMYAENVEV